MPSTRLNRHLPLSFHEMDAAAFEAMTVALVDKEPGITSAALYRVQRQRQFGIDVLGRREDQSVEVASCKCYSRIAKGKIKEWSEDFLKHWDGHWTSRKVRRFILVVAADVHSEGRDREIEEERKRFSAVGIEFDVWAPHQLQEKLRSQPGIVVQHLGFEHLERVCGVVSAPYQVRLGRGELQSGAAAEALQGLQSLVSTTVGHRLEHLLARFRTGDVSQTASALEEIFNGQEWVALDQSIKARVLRLRASIMLHYGDDAAASALSDQADACEPQTEPRLRAILSYRRDGAVAALTVLGEPSSQDGAHLKAAILLDHGDYKAAAAILNGHPSIDADHAETLRLRAALALRLDDRQTALAFTDAALNAAPNSPAVMRLAAMVHYVSALSPAITSDLATQASPLPLDLVREDGISRDHLFRAYELCNALARTDLAAGERRENELLALACLCNLRDRTSDADERLKAMLAVDPAWAAAAHWALARGLSFDRSNFQNAVRGSLIAGTADPDGVLLAAVLEEEDGRLEEAVRLLKTPGVFETPEARSLRDAWLLRCRRRMSPASTLAPGGIPECDLVDMVDHARTSGNWSYAEAAFERQATQPGRPDLLLLPLAQALAASERWEAIERHTDVLLAMATPEPVRIAAFAEINTGNHSAALDIVSRFRTIFSDGRLPSDLARIEVEALSRSGDQANALRNAVLIGSAETSTVEDHVTAAVAHLRAGDVRSAVRFADAARRSGHLHSRHAVQLAHAISPVDRAAASSLLKHALSRPIEPVLAPGAFLIASQLGLEKLAAPLMADVVALADQPGSGVWALNLTDLADFIRHQHSETEHLTLMHKAGQVPIHLAADKSGANLAHLFLLDGGEQLGRCDYPIMMLNGVRSTWNQVPSVLRDGPVHIDVTALLVADQLGLIDTLERMPGRVYLPPSLPFALLQMEERLRPHQPARLAGTREILRLVASGRICTINAGGPASTDSDAPPASQDSGRWTLDFDRDEDNQSDRSLDVEARRLNLHGLVDALLNIGVIDPKRHRAALDNLGGSGQRPPIGLPSQHDEVALDEFVAVELATVGILAVSAAAFRLLIDQDDVQALGRNVARIDEQQSLADRLATLTTRVAQNLTAGTFRTLPVTMADEEDEFNVLTRCLVELVRAPGVEGGITWIDDRHLTAHGLCGANRLLDTTGMLETFVEAELIDVSERWDALLRLRKSNTLFLPLTADEVAYHLATAPVVKGHLIETSALVTLRQYVAKALADAVNLDVKPAHDGSGPGELPFILSVRRVAENSLLQIWTAEQGSVEQRELQSSWVWKSLRVDRLPDVGLPGTAAGSWRSLLTLNYAALLGNGVHILLDVPRPNRSDRLRAYMKWVSKIGVPAWMYNDGQFAKGVANTLASMLTGLAQQSDDGTTLDRDARRFIQALLGHLIGEVPKPFHEHLLDDQELCQVAGIRRSEVTDFAGLQFDPNLLWRAAEKAIRGSKESVKTIDGRQTLSMRLRSGSTVGLELSGVLKGSFDNAALGLLARQRAVRIHAAQGIVRELGMRASDAAAAVKELAKAKRACDRVDAAARVRGSSIRARYNSLSERIQSGENISWADFDAPEPGPLLRYVALAHDAETAIKDRMANSARALIEDFGVVEAVRRVTSFPIPLPTELLAAVRALPELELKILLTQLSGEAATPLQLLHCLRLLRDMQDAGTDCLEARDAALQTLLTRWDGSIRLFLVLLRQFGEDLRPHGPISQGLRADEALLASWLHADLVARAVLTAGSDLKVATQRFEQRPSQREVARAVLFHPEYDGAAAACASMTAEGLLYYGLGYALGVAHPTDLAMPSAELLETLRNKLSVSTEGRRIPLPWILADREGANNELGSWFGSEPDWLFPETVGGTTEAARQLGLVLVDLQDVRTAQARHWLVMSVVVRPHLDEERRALAAEAVRNADFKALVEGDREIGSNVFRCVAELAHASGDADARLAFEEKLLCYAADCASARGGRVFLPGDEEAVFNLVEAVAACSRSETEAEGWSRFGPLMVRLAKVWPGALPRLVDVVGSLATGAHPRSSLAIWDAWLALRALN